MMRRRKRVTMRLSSAAVDTSRRSSRWCTLKSRRVSQFHNRCTGRDIDGGSIHRAPGRARKVAPPGREARFPVERRRRGKEGRARDRPIFAFRSRRTLVPRELFRLIVAIRCVVIALVAIIAQIEQRQRRSIGEDPSRGKRKKKLAGSEI